MEYVKKFFIYLVSGVGFSIGVAVVVYAYTLIDGESSSEPPTLKRLDINQVAISDVKPSEISRYLVVSGTISNISKTYSVKSVILDIELMKNGNIFHTCSDLIHEIIQPSTSSKFEAKCENIEPANSLPGITYNVRAREVGGIPVN